MNILQLCHRVPFPANDGGNIAMISLADSLLSQGVFLKMFTLNTLKHYVNLENISPGVRNKYSVESVTIDTTINSRDAFISLFTSGSYNVSRFYSEDFDNKLILTLSEKKWDIILLESLFMAPYIKAIRENSDAKIILRAHNVEHIIWERLSANEKNPVKRWYLSHLAWKLKKYEISILGLTDGILPITRDDEKVFLKMGCLRPMLVTPVGIDLSEYPVQTNSSRDLCVFHLGSMDWIPNLEGVQWFLEKCWQPIHLHFPKLKLFLAGRGFPAPLMKNSPANVICEGEILDAKKFMNEKQIMIVPLKSGGGMRVKIIQGMALGKTIISTTIGAEGINYTGGKDLLLADTPDEFLSRITSCLNDPDFCFEVAKNARKTVQENYSNDSLGKKVMEFLQPNIA